MKVIWHEAKIHQLDSALQKRGTNLLAIRVHIKRAVSFKKARVIIVISEGRRKLAVEQKEDEPDVIRFLKKNILMANTSVVEVIVFAHAHFFGSLHMIYLAELATRFSLRIINGV